MRFDSFAALLAVSNVVLGVSGLAAKRQDESSSITTTSPSSSPSPSPSSTTKSGTSSSSERPASALVPTTLSDGTTTTIEVADPRQTQSTTSSDGTASPTSTSSGTQTGEPAPTSTVLPTCNDVNAKPFCLPLNMSVLYVGKTYFVTWNPDFYPVNSSIQIKVQAANDSNVETWSSETIENGWGYASVKMEKDWLQGYSMYNLSFHAFNYTSGNSEGNAQVFDGPMITLENEPPRHYPPPPKNAIDKKGLFIGLPIGLAFVAFIVVGLFIGMRKNRVIGLGNIMGRRNRGYGVGKSRGQRLGLGKKGAIRLEDRDSNPQYNDRRGHTRGDSLGSLVSDDGRPTPGTNHFRDEIQRQRTGH